MAKSYYAILGVSSSATPEEIRKAFRRLAKEFHPDHYAGGRETFQEIQEAYSVLGDAQRRRQYEQSFTQPRVQRPSYPEPEPLVPEAEPIDLGVISPVRSFRTLRPSLDEIFDGLWRNFSGISRPKPGRVQDLTLEIPLTADQTFRGGTAEVLVPARAVCPTCRGYGGLGPYDCPRCAGEGAVIGEIPVSIAFPPGLTRNHAVTVPLDRFGIRHHHLTVIFRPTGAHGR